MHQKGRYVKCPRIFQSRFSNQTSLALPPAREQPLCDHRSGVFSFGSTTWWWKRVGFKFKARPRLLWLVHMPAAGHWEKRQGHILAVVRQTLWRYHQLCKLNNNALGRKARGRYLNTSSRNVQYWYPWWHRVDNVWETEQWRLSQDWFRAQIHKAIKL